MKKLYLFIIILLVIASGCFCSALSEVTGIKAYKAGDYDQIEVNTSSKVTPTVLRLETHNQIAIVLPNTTVTRSFNVPPPSSRIKNIQAVQFNQDTVYVIIESLNEIEYDLANIIGKNKIVLELGKERPIQETELAPEVTPEVTHEVTPEVAAPEIVTEEITKVTSIPAKKPDHLKIWIIGNFFRDSKKAIIKNDTIMVPARQFFESINGTTDFNKKTQTLYAKIKYEWRLQLKAGSKYAVLKVVDSENDKYTDKKITLTVAPAFIGGKFSKEFYIPLAPIAAALGYEVIWSDDRSKLYVNTKITDIKLDETGIVKKVTLMTTNPSGKINKRKEGTSIYIDFIGAKMDPGKNPSVIRGRDYDIKLYQLNDLVVTLKIYAKDLLYYTTSDFEENDQYQVLFAPAITKIDHARISDTSSKISIYSSEKIDYEEAQYQNPQRLVLDLKNTILKLLTPPQTDSSAIKGIRFLQNGLDPLTSRIVITLNNTTYKVSLSEDKKILSVTINDECIKPKYAKIFPLKGRTIVVDPGHSGKDPGTIGFSGSLEKNLTPKVAFKLCEYLYKGGANVILSKEKDVDMNNKEIVQLANRCNADLFVSLHYNAFNSPTVAGTETYYYSDTSIPFAKIAHKNLLKGLKRKNRGIKKVTYYIIHYAKMPAIILEALYITNPKEEILAKNAKYQNLIASNVYYAIKEYLSKNKNP